MSDILRLDPNARCVINRNHRIRSLTDMDAETVTSFSTLYNNIGIYVTTGRVSPEYVVTGKEVLDPSVTTVTVIRLPSNYLSP